MACLLGTARFLFLFSAKIDSEFQPHVNQITENRSPNVQMKLMTHLHVVLEVTCVILTCTLPLIVGGAYSPIL
jgi:hypothetical protein